MNAAQRWRDTWEECWPRHDVDSIAALYSPLATYRALAFRPADQGVEGVRRYLAKTFGEESDVICQFGQPTVSGRQSVIEWWASWVEGGEEVTVAGVTVVRFDESGLVTDHRDYWNQAKGRHEPFAGW